MGLSLSSSRPPRAVRSPLVSCVTFGRSPYRTDAPRRRRGAVRSPLASCVAFMRSPYPRCAVGPCRMRVRRLAQAWRSVVSATDRRCCRAPRLRVVDGVFFSVSGGARAGPVFAREARRATARRRRVCLRHVPVMGAWRKRVRGESTPPWVLDMTLVCPKLGSTCRGLDVARRRLASSPRQRFRRSDRARAQRGHHARCEWCID